MLKQRGLLLIVFSLVIISLMVPPIKAANTVTSLLTSGSSGAKKNLVIVGDGFAAGNDQTTFNNLVENVIMKGLFASGRFFNEDMNAFNIYRINAISNDSGVTQLSSNGHCPNCGHNQPWGTTDTTYPYHDTCQNCGTPMEVIVTTSRDTALDYRYSGVWGRCWMEAGPNYSTRFNNVVGGLVPDYDFVIIILNEANGGGCGGGGKSVLTLSASWKVIEHELGHAIGGLADEYYSAGNYTGGEPSKPNATITLDPLKWSDFVNPSTTIPTTATAGMDPLTVGAFEGAVYCSTGIYRPSQECRMKNHNNAEYCSVCYDWMKDTLDPFHEYTFNESYRGDFDGDGCQDLLIHNSNSITIYRCSGSKLEVMWSLTGNLPGWDLLKPGDRFYIGDFNGDGKDDAYVVNMTDWLYPYLGMLKSQGVEGMICVSLYELKLPGWDDMKPHDQFYVADFNNDKKDDLYVFNGQDWSMGYLEMLKSTGTSLQHVTRYDKELPGWDDMKPHDQFFIADFNNDKTDDLYVFNGQDWSKGYLEMLRSNGTQLFNARRYDGKLPGWDDMKKNDRFYAADFNKDGFGDIYVFNGKDWSMSYLEMLKSGGTGLSAVKRYDDSIPGWGRMETNDEFYAGDLNGDSTVDLYVYNCKDWSTEYLGLLSSSGTSLTGLTFYGNWIGSWNLGKVDKLIAGDFNGDKAWDIYIRNDNWLGMLKSLKTGLSQIKIYPNWIHNVAYHKYSWW